MKNAWTILILTLSYTFCSGQQPALDRLIEDYVDKRNFNGTILIQKDHKIIYEKGLGYANRQFSNSNQPETKFKIASITKLFTAVLILQLYERGILDLHKPIKTYLPDYQGEGADRVTIHQLLNNTSGIENIESNPNKELKNPWFDVYQKPYTTDQILNKFCSGKLENEPGSKFSYNNGDYVILGKIIEQIHRKSFDEVLHAEILVPHDLTNTGIFYQSSVIPNIASTYAWNDSLKIFENDRQAYIENWYASGAMYSNARDLLKFVNLLFEHQLIKRETLMLMTTPGLDNYGYGAWIRTIKLNDKSYKTMQRYGRIRGANVVLFRLMDTDTTIIILGNTNAVTGLGTFAYDIAKVIVE